MPFDQALKTLDGFADVHLSRASGGALGMLRDDHFRQFFGVRLPGTTHGGREALPIRIDIRASQVLTQARGGRQRDDGACNSEFQQHG